ncbi:hypothetical protein SMZ92_000159 [Cronobacter sakazakii]|nr:hypothetical protein [Cronobacter sakazakii]
MYCKKTNSVLLSIVATLLIVASLVLIKLLFADIKGFEWGSFTDWLSATGTFGTFIIAIIALIKVPDWMAQKHYDIAYSMIENAVFKDLNAVRQSSLHLKNKITLLTKNLRNSIAKNKEMKSDLINDTINSLDDSLNSFHTTSYSVINQLKSVSRTNYQTSAYCEEIVTILQNSHIEYHDNVNKFYGVLYDIEINMTDDVTYRAFMIEQLDAVKLQTIQLNRKLADFINNIYSQNRPIKDFIIQ